MDWSDQESTFQRWRRSSSAKCTVIGLVLLLVVAFFLFPTSVSSGSSQLDSQYAVVIDAGSSGSRVHVYEVRKHDGSYDVVDELFEQLKPGLSAFKDDPKAAAASLDPLLQKAAERVPPELHSQTAIGLGATAGLRMIGEAKASKILYAVRDHITSNYDFPIRHENDIRILDGNEEGKYAWIAVNTLLGQVGQDPSETYAACDLGGGSVQCMFAMPGDSASLRKGNPTQKDMPAGYVEKVTGGGRSYNLYVHSFLGYGLLAARMAVLDATPNAAAACMPADFTGEYTYGDKSVPASGRGTASFNSCRMAVQAALKTDKPCNDNVAPASECPIDGQWAGGLAKLLEKSPQFKLHLMSFFYEKTKSIGAGTSGKELDEGEDESSLSKFKKHASLACSLSVAQRKRDPTIHLDFDEDRPYLCLDAAYIYSFLVDGIGVDPDTKFVMEKKIKNHGKDFEAAWSLGMGMEIL